MKRKGVFAVIGASFLYGIMPIFMKEILNTGASNSTVVFTRFLFATIFSFIILKIFKINYRVTKDQLLQMIAIGFVGYGLTSGFLSMSYTLIPVGLATMFHFTNPLFVTLIMTFIFKEKPTTFKIISCVLAIGGLVLMADFSNLNAMGMIFAVASGITYSIYVVANKKSNFASLNNFVIIFYVSATNAFFFAMKALLDGAPLLLPDARSVGFMVIVSLFCTIFALYLLTYGIKSLGASNASVLNMLEPIISVIAGIVVYGDILPTKSFIGCALVVASGVIVAFDSIKN